jgi:hypothetical protein
MVDPALQRRDIIDVPGTGTFEHQDNVKSILLTMSCCDVLAGAVSHIIAVAI